MIKFIRKLLDRIAKRHKEEDELDEFYERIQFMKMKRSYKDSNWKMKRKYEDNSWKF